MSLRKKTLISTGITLLALIAVLYGAGWILLINRFARFEEFVVRRNLDRAYNTLSNELAVLEGIAASWAAHEARSPIAARPDLDPGPDAFDQTLIDVRLDFAVLMDESGQLTGYRALDRKSGQPVKLDEEVSRLLKSPEFRARARETGGVMSGLMAFSPSPVMMVLRAIPENTLAGASQGAVIVGRFLDEPEMTRLGHLSRLEVSVHRSTEPQLPKSVAGLPAGVGPVVPLSSDSIAGFRILDDIMGHPTVVLQMSQPREVAFYRHRVGLWLLGTLLAYGVVFGVVFMVVLDRHILKRLMKLGREVTLVGSGAKPSERVDVDGRDELAQLACEINGMLAAISRSKERLRLSEATARALLDAPGVAALLVSPSGILLGTSAKAAECLGGRTEDLVGWHIGEMFPPSVRETRVRYMGEVAQTGVPAAFEDEVDGVAWSHKLYPILDEQGRVQQIALFSQDVTEQHHAAEALRNSEERFLSFLRNFHGITFEVNADGKPLLCQGDVFAITGYTADEILSGRIRWFDIVHPADRDMLREEWDDLWVAPVTSSQKRYRICTREGGIRWIQAFLQNSCDEAGKPRLIQGVLYDITERVEAEEALQESLETTAEIVRTIPSGLFIYRYEAPERLVLLDGNPEAERVTGVAIHEARGREFDEIWPNARALGLTEACLHAARTGETWKAERWHYSDGRIGGFYHIRAFRLRHDKLAVAFEDVTAQVTAGRERLRLEEQLHHAQKMEAVGQLAGGVAHDFNNLLSGILGYASLIRLESPAGSPAAEAAHTIEQAAERAADLTRQLLGFARRGKFQNVPVDIHRTIQEVIRLLGRTLDKNIRITQKLRAAAPAVQGDPNQLQQVFINLAVNARDAMPDGGDLVFESEMAELETGFPEVQAGAPAQTYIVVSVTDQGSGISKEHLGRVFEPFFTTKEQGKGTGMGLAMVYGIIKNHGGFVQVESAPGRGATFRVYLPSSGQPAEKSSEPVPSEEMAAGSARILLVDDEEVVRNVGTAVLKRLGYSVVTAANGREAVEYYFDHADEIDLVIIDMVMPLMGGQDCFRAMKKINPGVRAVLSSGYGFNGKASELLDEGMLGFIQKPYQIAEFAAIVAKSLSIGCY